ncbi:N-acyl homoserine lactonase family protein [Nocardia vaccinii]|uniref:N-acyl homoserine lactonase family protein n=1 Tax=Nocardia vaccinii TaxID=1822 RepID=UPI00082A960A|nr:N-acyl homoserine lactonase family protein [Nocardia vaccinii]
MQGVQAPGAQVYAIAWAEDVRTDSDQFYRFKTYNESDNSRHLVFFAWVIIESGGVTLFDTGASQVVAAKRGINYMGSVVDGIRELGIGISDVDTVVVSHLHYDHSGGLTDFPEARIAIHPAEIEFWTGPNLSRQQFNSIVELDDILLLIRAIRAGRVDFVSEGHVITPNITVRHLPGHSVGQIGLQVGGADGLLLAADAAHYYDEVFKNRPFTVFSELPVMYDTYDRIRALIGGAHERLVPGHDPEVYDIFGVAGSTWTPGRIPRVFRIQ